MPWKDAAAAVLGLLHHDQCWLFTNHTPYATSRRRTAWTRALAVIAASHPKLVMNNPLIKNPMWLNYHTVEDRMSEATR